MKLFANKKRSIVIVVVLAIVVIATFLLQQPPTKINFSADVKPILNKKCISCHGGVKKQAGFSFLFREEALAVTESGKPAIIPGDPDGSEMIRRITISDPEERMPYKHDPLSKEEISILKKWIKQGAKWGEHWAYVPVEEPTVPTGKRRFFGLLKPDKPVWVKNEIDYFINEKLV
ncbi:MAG TPA: c-type cytochrome domain-containing protein, partial [Lacibacter sp.]|nr:c-type cytochrome domain-containing protein [Lacibacter sp.]